MVNAEHLKITTISEHFFLTKISTSDYILNEVISDLPVAQYFLAYPIFSSICPIFSAVSSDV